jgi:hypothetical protein
VDREGPYVTVAATLVGRVAPHNVTVAVEAASSFGSDV